MNILLLGPHSQPIENHLQHNGHNILRIEDAICPDLLQHNKISYIISYRYRHIIKSEIIDLLQNRIVNLHISLLPWNKGADPNLWSYLEDTPRGVSIHAVDIGLDTGDIILQQEVHIDLNKDTLRSSWDKLTVSVENLFTNNSHKILNNLILPVPQTGLGSSHRLKDKDAYAELLVPHGWNTPVRNLIGKAV